MPSEDSVAEYSFTGMETRPKLSESEAMDRADMGNPVFVSPSVGRTPVGAAPTVTNQAPATIVPGTRRVAYRQQPDHRVAFIGNPCVGGFQWLHRASRVRDA